MKRNLWQEPRARGDDVEGSTYCSTFSRASPVKVRVLWRMGGGESLDESSWTMRFPTSE